MALLLGSLASTTALGTAVEWKATEGGNGHWYEFRSEYTPWNIARNQSHLDGGYLATVQGHAENNFVKSIVPYSTWLGGTDEAQEGTWVWENGEPWNYSKWGNSEPNNNGAEHYTYLYPGYSVPGTTALWYDGDLNATIGYTVEWSADCNGDGIVDYGQILDGTYADANGNGVPDCCDNGTPCDDATGNAVQWPVSEGGNGNWYELIQNDPNRCWLEAQAYAEALGGRLASLETLSEFEFAKTIVYGGTGPYSAMIGLQQDEDGAEPAGGWRWLSGEPLQYDQWASTLDDAGGCQDWASFADGSGYGKLDDIYPCEGCVHQSYEPRMLVEWSADCNGDGIVDYGQILDGSLLDSDFDGIPDICDNLITVAQDGTGDFMDIQDAIEAADDGDVILVSPGTYAGDGSEVARIDNKLISLKSTDGPYATFIDGEGQRRCLVVTGDSAGILIDGFTIHDGYTADSGGGMHVSGGASSTIQNMRFTECSSGWEGGGFNARYAGSIIIDSCEFGSNSAFAGGGLALTGLDEARVENCTFFNNTTIDDGAGLLAQQSYNLHILETEFTGNQGDDDGGAVWIASSVGALISDCTMISNTVTGRAGGIHIQSNSIVTVMHCTLQSNNATYGGGAFVDAACTLALSANLFCSNSASYEDHVYGQFTDNGDNTFAESCDCPADINDDGIVDVTDVLVVIAVYGSTNSLGDVNNDGFVNVTDLLIVLESYGADCP